MCDFMYVTLAKSKMKLLVSVVLFLSCLVGESKQQSAPGVGEYRAQTTLNGLMDYYWNHDPAAKNISFFFACGQIGGQGGGWDKCSCTKPDSCVNCYRWWDAVAIESVATYGIYMNTSNHSDIAGSVFDHSPYNGNWNGLQSTFIDDFAWYGIAYLKVYEWRNDTEWLNRSTEIYEWAWKYGWDEPCGGFWWSTWPGQRFKDSITIMEMLHFSSKLATMFPNNTEYIHNALKVWKWIFSFQNGRGLLTDKNLISTGLLPEECCNSSAKSLRKRCYSAKLAGTSYNQGLFLSAAAYLYAFTKDKQYLDAGLVVLDGVLQNYTTAEGVLLDEPRSAQTYEGQCLAGKDPGGDWYSFNGIFMLHLGYFTETLATMKALSDVKLQEIQQFVQRTSDSAWNKSAVWPPFHNIKDACNSDAVDPKMTSPKFHWWWAKKETQQVMPPDAGLYLHKTGLRCMGNNTQLWDGAVASEDVCEMKCTRSKRCSKYLFSTTQYHCWTWSYNRTDHICNNTDRDFNVGVKRPVGHDTSCKAWCGSDKPLKVEPGVCYCDAKCTTHLDCCLDYADECVKQEFLSCKGLCKTAQAQAIEGGGYCWCLDGCNPQFTDNNSMGSCCPDYPQQCLGVKMPACLDARSQGSALNLFLAHLRISTL